MIKNFVLLNLKDTLTFFNKNENEQNLEIYLKNPIRANSFKNKIQDLNPNYFNFNSWTDLNKSFFSALKEVGEKCYVHNIIVNSYYCSFFNIISGLTILIKK